MCVCVAHMVKGSTWYYSTHAISASFCLSCYILQLIGLFGANISPVIGKLDPHTKETVSCRYCSRGYTKFGLSKPRYNTAYHTI